MFLFKISFLILIVAIEVHSIAFRPSNVYRAFEEEPFTIKCPAPRGIEIRSAKWQYKRDSLKNLFTKNIRFPAFPVGRYFGMCKWDVTDYLRKKCSCRTECGFIPERTMFGDCGYKMYLEIKFVCVRCTYICHNNIF